MAAAVATAPHHVSFATEDQIHRFKAEGAPSFCSPLRKSSYPPADRAPHPYTIRSSKRPQHKRTRSRNGSNDPLLPVRHAFHQALPEHAIGSEKLRNIAKDFYACAVGLSAGFKIKNYALDHALTEHLMLELSQTVLTNDVLMVLDIDAQILYIIHTQILNHRIENSSSSDENLFLLVEGGLPSVVPIARIEFLGHAIHHLKHILRRTTHQVVTTSEFHWSLIESCYRMLTVGDWLINQPVCYVIQPGLGAGSTELSKMMRSDQSCWSMSVSAEGNDPENDHVFESCQFPTSLFTHNMVGGEKTPLGEGICSMNAIQDRVQSTMFERLNGNDLASSIWSELTCSTDGPKSFA